MSGHAAYVFWLFCRVAYDACPFQAPCIVGKAPHAGAHRVPILFCVLGVGGQDIEFAQYAPCVEVIEKARCLSRIPEPPTYH